MAVAMWVMAAVSATIITFGFGIPVPLVIHVAGDAPRPIVLRRAVCGGTPEGADSRHCLQQLFTRIAQDRPTADRRQLAN